MLLQSILPLKSISYPFITLSIILFITSCQWIDDPNSINTDNQERIPLSKLSLKTADNCDSLKKYVVNSLIEQHTHISPYRYYSCNNYIESPPAEGGAVAAPAPNSPEDSLNKVGSGPDDVSQTNNQEAGVNEADMVKVDTETGILFIGHGSHLIIADAFPPQTMNKLKEIDLKNQVIDLYYDEPNHRVIVMTRYQFPYYPIEPALPVGTTPAIFAPEPINPETVLFFFDVSDPRNPVQIDRIAVDGYYQTSRRIENRLHLVTSFYTNSFGLENDSEFNKLKSDYLQTVNTAACADPDNYDPDAALNDPAVIQAKAVLSTHIETLTADLDVSTILPTARRGEQNNEANIAGFLQCSGVNYPEIKSHLNMQVVSSMDTNGQNISASSIINNSWISYVSQSFLYLVENSSNWWWGSSNIDQMAIYKFSISSSQPSYVSTGSVDGHTYDSFNLSEHKDKLRIVSTQWDNTLDDQSGRPFWRRTPKNHLTILEDANNGQLVKISQIRDLAINETIRSSRFIGDRGFMVTFRNIDPLFTFDLSDPFNPILKGELKIPGFSSYIHPYDDNHLLTIGRAGDEAGTGLGTNMQLQLIDVSDLANPQVVKTYEPMLPKGYSWSSAQYDHHAFTFYKKANLLAIPLSIWPNTVTGEEFTGVIAFNVSPIDGIKELGRVDHADLAKQYYCVDNTLASNYRYICDGNNYLGWASPRRTVVMTEGENVYLYTLSDVGLKAGELKDLSVNIGSMIFPPQPYPYYGPMPIDAVR